jgi:hypothetical protein
MFPVMLRKKKTRYPMLSRTEGYISDTGKVYSSIQTACEDRSAYSKLMLPVRKGEENSTQAFCEIKPGTFIDEDFYEVDSLIITFGYGDSNVNFYFSDLKESEAYSIYERSCFYNQEYLNYGSLDLTKIILP